MSSKGRKIGTVLLVLLGVFLLCVGGGAYLLLAVYPAWMNESFEVQESADRDEHGNVTKRRQLLIGKINHGTQYLKPGFVDELGNPNLDFSRLAATYFHRSGPVGRAMETINWFPASPDNTYHADARMPASLVGQCAQLDGLPLGPLVGLWSEPPIGKVLLGEGCIASYARPYQCVDFFERNPAIVALSQPGKEQKFTFIEDARQRGAQIRILEGPERATLAGKGPRGFYKVMVVDLLRGGTSFLTMPLVVEEFMTKEAMASYFDAMTDDGVLLLHTSNRAYDLTLVLGDVASSLGFASAVAHDRAQGFGPGAGQARKGHFTSEWVVVARRPEILATVKDRIEPAGQNQGIEWRVLRPTGRPPWTDGAANSFRAIQR